MDYHEAKSHRDALYQAHDAAADCLYDISGNDKGPMGLTPDHIKNTSEWQLAYKKERAAFDRLRKHNTMMVKAFKKEMREERQQRYQINNA